MNQPPHETRTVRTAILTGIGIAAVCAPVVAGDVTYRYREDDGTVWFTDRRPDGAELDDYEFLGYRGRPPASHSCRGLPPAELEARVQRIITPLKRLAERYGVDHQLVRAMVRVESCFDPYAVSSVGALGLMQLMPATAEALGVTQPFDIQQNLRGGIEYFSLLLERFDGNTVHALAAYNAGPTAVERYNGIPPYPQTQRYVQRVLEHWNELRAARAKAISEPPQGG